MRKLFAWRSFVMIFCMVMTASLWSCNDEDVENSMPFIAVPENQDTLTLVKEGGESVLEILSNREWSIKVPAAAEEWLSVSPDKGENNGKVTILTTQNGGGARSAELTLSIGISSTKVLVVQKGESGAAGTEALYQENCGTSVEKNESDKWPYADQYTGWEKGGSLDQSGVTYNGKSANVSNSGNAFKPAEGSSLSGAPYVGMNSSSAIFNINNINVTGKTNFTFKFGAIFQSAYPIEFGQINVGDFKLEASVDGKTWAPLTYTLAVEDGAHWYMGTAEFKVAEGTTALSIRFSTPNVQQNQGYRFDDFKLFEGGNGELIEGGSGETPEQGDNYTTIAELVKKITTEKTDIGNYKVKGIVVTDMTNKNFSAGGFSIQTEGATTAGNGILVFKYKENFEVLGLKVGDEVEIDLSAAQLQAFKGAGAAAEAPACNELIVPGTDCIKKTGKTVEIAPVTITADQIADFQSMYVQIENAQAKNSDVATWEGKAFDFAANGKDFPVYISKNATIVGQPFLTGKGTIKGLAYVYGGSKTANSMAQLVPRDYSDVSGLTGGEVVALSFGTPSVSGAMTVGKEVSGVKISIPYFNAKGTEKYTVSATVAGVNGLNVAGGEKTLNAGNGTIELDVTGTPDVEGEVIFTINGIDGLTDNTVAASVKGEVVAQSNSADFNTLEVSSGYKSSQTTAAGWIVENCAVQSGGDSVNINAAMFPFIGTTADRAVCLNGKTSTIGVVKSPILKGGCGELRFNYGHAFGEKNGVDLKIEIKQGGNVVKTLSLKKENADVQKLTKYEFVEAVNVAGDFEVVITNNAPTQSGSNKDRVSIWNLTWTSYSK